MHDSRDTTSAPRIVELRRYLLRPDRRDDLIELFDGELVESQEAVGIDVLGQFRDLDRPDYFVWLRGFDDMESRRESLAAFYGGPVWARHAQSANSTMIDSDNVLLLRRVSAEAGFEVTRPEGRDRHPKTGVIVALIQHRRPGCEPEFNRWFATNLQHQLDAARVRTIGLYETEPAENSFPRLPVRAANVLVWFGILATSANFAAEWSALRQLPAWPTVDHPAGELSTGAPDVLRLAPTSRSRLDGTA